MAFFVLNVTRIYTNYMLAIIVLLSINNYYQLLIIPSININALPFAYNGAKSVVVVIAFQ